MKLSRTSLSKIITLLAKEGDVPGDKILTIADKICDIVEAEVNCVEESTFQKKSIVEESAKKLNIDQKPVPKQLGHHNKKGEFVPVGRLVTSPTGK